MNYDQDQTWPTQQEIDKSKHQLKKRVPKGTSQYQAAWILSDDEDFNPTNQQNVIFLFLFFIKNYFLY